jgi:hypothetical protein
MSKLGPAGNTPVYPTYLVGIDPDEGLAMAVDNSRHAYLTGRTIITIQLASLVETALLFSTRLLIKFCTES